MSDDPASAVGVRVADCVPVLLADRRQRVVGAAHAGWRGTAQNAVGAAVRAMTLEFACDPDDIVAAIGPSLGPCCGEVGDEVAQEFARAGHGVDELARWFSRGPSGRLHIDLWSANRDQLVVAGVRPENVHLARLCTKTHADVFHSYRAEREKAGRMVGIITPRRVA